MKKFLLLFCVAVLVCSLMIVPALAADEPIILNYDGMFPYLKLSEPISGDFILKFYDDSGLFWETPSFTIYVDYNSEKCIDMIGPSGETFYFCTSYFDEPDRLVLYFYFNEVETGDTLGDRYSISKVELVPVTSDSVSPAPEPVSPIAGIFSVFGGVGSWIGAQLSATTSLFWNGQSLTFLGVLSVCALALAVILLLIVVVTRFLRFGG